MSVKKLFVIGLAIGVVIGSFLVGSIISKTNSDDSLFGATVLFPYQGGTGTGQVPTVGQVLIASSTGLYEPLSTSSLGIVSGGVPVSSSYANINGLTSGSITFASSSGQLWQDNSNLFWDDTNNRLGIGTSTVNHLLTLNSNPIATGTLTQAIIDTSQFAQSNTVVSGNFTNYLSQILANPTNNTDGNLRGGYFSAQSLNTNSKNNTGSLVGASFVANHNGSGDYTDVYGTDTGAGNSGTGKVTNLVGQNFLAAMGGTSFTNNAVGIKAGGLLYGASPLVTSSYGILAVNATNYSATGQIIKLNGIAIENMTVGTNNTNLLLGTSVIPSGNFSIYNSSAYNNYFAGNVGIGTTTPFEELIINGDGFITGDLYGGNTNLTEGMQSDPTVADATGVAVSVTSADVLIRSSADFNGDGRLYRKTVPASTTLAMTDDSINYIIVTWNGGSPRYEATTTRDGINLSDIIPVTRIYMSGGNIEYRMDYDYVARGATARNFERVMRLRGTTGIEKESGLVPSETATRIINISSGYAWFGLARKTLSAIVQNTTNTEIWYHSGGDWTSEVTSTYNNYNYDDGSDIQVLTANRYTVNCLYRNLNTNEIDIVLGQGDYTLAQALASTVPAPPEEVANFYVYVGRIIVQKGSNTAYAIQVVTQFNLTQTPISSHSDLSNLTYALSGHTGFAGLAVQNTFTASNTFANKVGIGTTTFSDLLSVAGNINTTGTYKISGVDYGQYFINSAGVSGQLWASDGSGRGGWINTSTLGVTASAAGDDYQIQYSASSSLAALDFGNAGEVLMSNGTGALPTWVATTTLVGTLGTMAYETAIDYLKVSTAGETYLTLAESSTSTWNEAYSWGDWSLEGFLTSASASSSYLLLSESATSTWNTAAATVTASSSFWDTAYSWGDWSLQGFLTTTTLVNGSSDRQVIMASSTATSGYEWVATSSLAIPRDFSITIVSTSLQSTATSTFWLAPAMSAQTWTVIACYVDVGTSTLAFGDGTNYMTEMVVTTTPLVIPVSANNTFTQYEKRQLRIGSTVGSPNNITCGVRMFKD
jgi:hypothetical protein